MKRLIAPLLCLLLLLGCARGGAMVPTAPTAAPAPPTQTTAPLLTEPTETTAPPTEPTVPVSEPPEPADTDFVRIRDYLPYASQSLPYATTENFTGEVIYEFTDAWLRYGTAKKLVAVSRQLALRGYTLLIWDAFRPTAAQFKLWEVCPDPTYVANPETGYSSHSRGNTVDLTILGRDGLPLEMPTDFDDFSTLADRNYSDCTDAARANALLLETTMEANGFSGYFGEWWHFSDTESYPVEENFTPADPLWLYADCKEFITLRTNPSTQAQAILTIARDESFQLLARYGEFGYVEYQGQRGYVLLSYTAPVSAQGDGSLWAANCEEFISLRPAPGSSDRLAKIPAGNTFTLETWVGKYAKVNWKGQEGYVLTGYIAPGENWPLALMLPTALYSYDQLLRDAQALAKAYPRQVTLSSIGISEEGREIPVLVLGNPEAEHQILLQGSIHGREHMTGWLLMAMAEAWLMEGQDNVCWHIIPMVNPDGVTISQTSISQWKANSLGVDLNRNFPAGWESLDSADTPGSQWYKGEAPLCAPEAAALAEYTTAHALDATLSYHASGSLIYWDYGTRQDVKAASLSLAKAVGAVTGYPAVESTGLDAGGYKDWAMEALGIPSLTVEIGCEEAPLAERECYAIFYRNRNVMNTVANWLASQDGHL